MKKRLLALGLGALLLAGSAATASAASQVDFSGYYRAHFSNLWNRTYDTSEDRTSDSGFFNRFNMDIGFHATDEVSVYWRMRAPASYRWGGAAADNNAQTVFVYGEAKQDWGKVSIGRLAAKFYFTGLANLGWQPMGADGSAIITLMNPFNISDDEHDGIRYANRWDNFQLVAQFSRLASETPDVTNEDSKSSDFYLLEGAYFWDGGGASLGFHYLNHNTNTANATNNTANATNRNAALKAFYLNPAVSHRWDSGFGLHFEGKAGWGKDDMSKYEARAEKLRGYGFYLDLDYNYGPGNVNLAGWWTSGDDGTDPDKRKDFVGMGRNFKPLLIAYGRTAGHRLTGTRGGVVREASGSFAGLNFDGGDVSNHWVIDLNGNHKLAKDITMTYALAYLSLTKAAEGQKKDLGWEADLSFQIQLLDNLKLGTSFGYFAPGDALKVGDDSAAATYAWFNTLTFSF